MPSQDALDIHQTGGLSDITLSELQLHRQPFGPVAPDAPTFSDGTSAEQLADVKQALINGDDLLLILGEHGAGKSVLLGQLGNSSGPHIQCFSVKGSPRFSTLNLFAGMLEAFKRKPPEKLKDILDELIPCLQTMVERNTLSAIVLDDADQTSETELTQLLSSMLYINSQDETLMRVALAAPPEFEDRIPDLLPEGADLPYSSLTIDGMDEARAAAFLGFRLHEAGHMGELPFADHQISELVSQSGGFPASLQVASANALNLQYDPDAVENPVAVDLNIQEAEPFLQSRKGKFGLGLLATALILGGLTMFVPDAADDQERYGATADDPQLDLPADSEPLRVVEEKKLVPLPPETTLETAESSSVLVPPDKTSESDVSDPAEITINGATNAVEAAAEAIDSNTLENGNLETADTPDLPENTAEAVAELPTPDLQDPAEPAAADTSGSEIMNPPVIIVPESDTETETAEAAIDAPVRLTIPDNTAASELPDNSPADSPSESTTLSDDAGDTEAVTEQVAVLDSTPDVNPAVADILESPTWILVQNPELITVQMSASRDQKSIESFLQRNRDTLAAPNSIYSFQRNGETWYALLHGLFPSFDEAQSVVEQMPATALTDQPWIRNVGRIQTVLRAQ